MGGGIELVGRFTMEVHLNFSEAPMSLQGIMRNFNGVKKMNTTDIPGMGEVTTFNNNYRYPRGITAVLYLLRLASGEDAALAQKVFSP